MARRPTTATTAPVSRGGRFPDLPDLDGPHDVAACPTCGPIVTSPAYRRGVENAHADHPHHQGDPTR